MYTEKSEYYKYQRLLLILLGSICKKFIPHTCFLSCEINVDVLKMCVFIAAAHAPDASTFFFFFFFLL